MSCKICNGKIELIEINGEKYKFCSKCHFLERVNILTEKEEKDRYDLHICDEDYIKYMNNIYLQIKDYIKGDTLDYGCGKIHILSDILNQNNIKCDYYDYYYYKNVNLNKYDTIILIEVIEHILDVNSLFKEFDLLLNKHGRLIIMTNFLVKDLNNWWYIRDKTHVSIFNLESFKESAHRYNYKIIDTNNKNLIILEHN